MFLKIFQWFQPSLPASLGWAAWAGLVFEDFYWFPLKSIELNGNPQISIDFNGFPLHFINISFKWRTCAMGCGVSISFTLHFFGCSNERKLTMGCWVSVSLTCHTYFPSNERTPTMGCGISIPFTVHRYFFSNISNIPFTFHNYLFF